jgi:GNAT superfamily N-acetyltransferase
MVYEILPATDATMDEVEIWLDEEETLYQAAYEVWEKGEYNANIPPRGFRCNWKTVKKSWCEGKARVDVLLVDGQTIGFLNGTDILEIKPAFRKAGYGRVLADFMLNLAYDEGYSVVEIDIAPETAAPFWKQMGFSSVSARRGNGSGIYAYKVLPRIFRLTDGKHVPYSVEFFSEDERYKEIPKPFAQFSGLGEYFPDGALQLPERAFCHQPMDAQHVDYFVKIEIDRRIIYFDKVKYEEGKQYGVERDAGFVHFIDRINPQIASIIH